MIRWGVSSAILDIPMLKKGLSFWGYRKRRLLAVMFTDRREAIRIISARRVTRSERKNYEERLNETTSNNAERD